MTRPSLQRLVAISAIALMGATAALAEPALTGKWQGETDGGASILLDLTVKGTTLTGTLTRNGHTAQLSEGKVSKNTFTFRATLNDRTEGFSGQLEDDRVKIWLDRQGESKAITLTRVTSTLTPSIR